MDMPASATIDLNQTELADEVYCVARNASYLTRVDNPEAYDWCIVPNSATDVILFAGLSVVLASLVHGKHATLVILLAGGALMGLAWGVNLGQLGNSIAWWLGISPWQLFFYIFLPPLLLDAAVKIDWFVFKKIMVQVVTLAFLVVGLSCAVMIPIMLYMLNLRADGWNWAHACMFGAMVASTDAVAIVAVMKTGGGPKQLRSLLEGESLLNDASGLTLFEIFFHYVIEYADPLHAPTDTSVGHILTEVIVKIIQFGGIGFVMGMAFGVTTRVLLRFMRRIGAGRDQEVALTVAMAYLAYYITQTFCHGSGVVAVAVMGLYGAVTGHWDMSTSAHEEGTFDGFWDTLAFIANSIVFLYSGASCVNFFIRSSMDLLASDQSDAFAKTLWMVPIIYIILSILRFALIALFRPLFIATKGDMSFKEAAFVAVAGLRGSVSLIMGQAVVTERALSGEIPVVKAQIIFWTAGFVLLTLLVNAPLLPRVLRWLGLNRIPDKQLRRRQRAIEALGEHTQEIIEELRDDEDELLSGVDWAQVERFVDMGRRLNTFSLGHLAPRKRKFGMLMKFFRRCCGKKGSKGAAKGGDDADASNLGRGAFGKGGGGGDGADGGYRRSSMAAYLGSVSQQQTEMNGAKDLEQANGNGGVADLQRRSSSDSDGSDASNVLHDVLGNWFNDMEDIDVLHQEVPFLLKQQTRPQDLADHQRHAQQVIKQLKGQAAGDGPTANGATAALEAVNSAAVKAADLLARQGTGDSLPGGEAAQPKLQLLASLVQDSQPSTEGILAGSGTAAHSSTAASSSTDAERITPASASDEHPLQTSSASSSGQPALALQSAPISGSTLDAVLMPPLPRSLAAPSREAMQPPDAALHPTQQPLSPLNTSSGSSGVASTSTALGTTSGTGLLARLSPLNLLKHPTPALSPQSAPSQLRSLATRSAGMYASYADQAQQQGREMQAIGVSKGRVYKNLARSSHTGDGSGDGSVGPAAAVGAALGRRSVNLGRGSVGMGGRHTRTASGSGDVDMGSIAESGHRRHGSGIRDADDSSTDNSATGSGRRPAGASAPRSLATRSQAAYLVPRMQDLGRLSHHPEHPHTPNSARSMHSAQSPFAPGMRHAPEHSHQRALGTCSMPAPYHALSVASPVAGSSLGGGGSQQPGRKSRPLGVMSSLHSHSEDEKEQALHEDELADARVWLVSGLKRYFHGKRMAGLLSSRGLRILDFACDTVLDDPYRPLSLWCTIQKDAVNNLVVKATTTSLFALRRTAIALMRPRLGHPGRLLSAPFRFMAALLQTPLNKLLLLSVEVAMEYLMGLTSSPYVQWLQESEVWGALLAEIQEETAQVWQFLIDREIEAPERYSAIQSYRAAMAILRQQVNFVEELFESGMIDDFERDTMLRPIDSQERLLEFLGPTWRAPNTLEVITNLPFMRQQPPAMCGFFIKHGRLAMYSSGSELPNSSDEVYIVTSGIIKVTYKPDMGSEQEYFLGTGGIFNLYHCLTQEHLPGTSEAVAQGNVLGKGPVVFILSRKALHTIHNLAQQGDPSFYQLEVDMYRLAALFVLQRLKPQLLLDARQAFRPAAPRLAQGDGDDVEAVRQGRAAQVSWLHKKVAAMRSSIQMRVAYGELHELPPGGTLQQTSSVVLLRGSVESHCEVQGGGSALTAMALRHMTCAGRHARQVVLPWVWEMLSPQELENAQEHVPRAVPTVTLTAGPQGATLLVCPAPGQEHTQHQHTTTPPASRRASLSGAAPPGMPPLPGAELHQGLAGAAATRQLPTIRQEGPRAAHAAAAAGADAANGERVERRHSGTDRRQSGSYAAMLPDTMAMTQRHGGLTRVRSSRTLNAGGGAGGRGGMLLGEQGVPGMAHGAAATGPSPLSRAASRPTTEGGAASAGASGAAAGGRVGSSSAGGAEGGTGAAAGAGRGSGGDGAPVVGFRRTSLKALNVPQGGKGGFERIVSSNGRNKP